jgi:alcohol dehydrogenase class IV
MMISLTYYQPTEIRFGRGRIKELGQVVACYGKRVLFVTGSSDAAREGRESAKRVLEESGVEVFHFGGVVSNPTTESINAGAEMARARHVEVVIGFGGGSSMDSAKAIAVGATHEGTAWDYLFFKKEPTEKTLPIIAVPTTSGTGSHVNQAAVLTETATKTKSAIFHTRIFPKEGIVDPKLMVSVPSHVTASTGFDVFAHSFEAFIHVGGNPYVEILAVEAMRLVKAFLPVAIREGSNIEAREKMAWADTLAGLCIASAGVTLPHGIGMTIGGFCPHVSHGQSLVVTYPEFVRFTWESAVEKFAVMGRILNPELEKGADRTAAEASCEAVDAFLKEIGMWTSFEQLKVSEEELVCIADNSRVLPDYKNNPRIASRDEIYTMLKASHRRD